MYLVEFLEAHEGVGYYGYLLLDTGVPTIRVSPLYGSQHLRHVINPRTGFLIGRWRIKMPLETRQSVPSIQKGTGISAPLLLPLPRCSS